MPGYTHTCASCEEKLKIHERYVGRALHCPHCGTEFLADPTLADVEDLIEDLAPPKRRGFPWLAVTVVALLATLALVLGQSGEGGWLSEIFRPTRTAGQFAALVLEGREMVPAAMDQESVVFVVDALEDDDPGSLEAVRVQGKIIAVASGTKVKLIEQRRRERIARVRILEGPWTGRVLWVPLMAVR